jgi:O-antigen ligase
MPVRILRLIAQVTVFAIPLSQYASVRLLVLAAILSLFVGRGRETAISLARSSWDVGLYLLALLVGILYSDDVVTGMRLVETSFSLLAVPLVLARLQQHEEVSLPSVVYPFAAGLITACLICLANAFIQYGATGDVEVFFFERFTGVLNLQPAYLAYYLIFCIGFGLYKVFYGELEERRLLAIVVILFFFTMLILSGGSTAFISLVLIFSFFVLKFLLEERQSYKRVVFVGVCFMLVVMFLVSSLHFWNEWSLQNDSWERYALWESAIRANPNIWLGVGTGDYRLVLNQYYQSHGMTEFAQESYNAHNQFIHSFFTIGLMGCLALIWMMIRPIIVAIRTHDILSILVMFPFIMYGMTEVFLGRYAGVVFFALLHELVMLRSTQIASRG